MRKRILVLLLAGAVAFTAACSKPEKNTAAEAAPTPEVKKNVEAFGTIEVNEIRNVNLDFDSVVERIEVKEGQPVKKGDILVALDMKNYTEQVKSKEHELNIIRLEVKKLEGKIIEEQLESNNDPDIRKLINDLNYANEVQKKALEEQKAKDKLLETGAISQYEYEEFLKTVDAKKKNAEDIKYSLDMAMYEKRLGNKDISDSIAIQNEKAATVESEISQMKSRLSRGYISENNIVSDIENGVVYEIGYKPGDSINSSKKVLSIMNMDTMVVKADVAEEFIKDVKLGADVEIVPIADKSKQYKGKVIDISSKAVVQNGETVVPVEISIDNKDNFLLPNFNVDVSIYMESL